MASAPVRLPRMNQSTLSRISELERREEYRDTQIKAIQDMLTPMHEVFLKALGIKWLLAALAAISGTTAVVVTAAIAAARYISGH